MNDVVRVGGQGVITKVLFLDDMSWRHKEFANVLDRRGIEDVRIHRAWTAQEAIDLLEAESFDQVFLDHDLSEDDIMVKVDGKSACPTGMDVVMFLMSMDSPPQDIVVHSLNGPARDEMVRRLEDSGRFARVRNLPFTELLRLLDPRFQSAL